MFKIIKTSLYEVWDHKKEWVRLAFAPFVIWGISFLLMKVSDGFMLEFNLMPVLNPFSQGLYWLGFLIATFILYINGFRYAILGETRDTWWIVQFNCRLIKSVLYGCLILGILGSMGGMVALLVLWLLPQSIVLAAIIGIICGLFVGYIAIRLGFIQLLISIDTPSPLRESWHLLKGHVMYLLGITLFMIFVSLGVTLASSLVFGISILPLIFFINSDVWWSSLTLVLSAIWWSFLTLVLSAINCFISWATLIQVYAHVYKDLKEKTASSGKEL